MRRDDIFAIVIVVVLVIAVIALFAGRITNQLLAPVPSIAGPLGAAVALIVFVFLVGKGATLLINQS